ncbi:MAG: hypothetical protein CMI63_11030 [Parvularcula sp.]|nr:hypothetical protein [Parvularcula sp.]
MRRFLTAAFFAIAACGQAEDTPETAIPEENPAQDIADSEATSPVFMCRGTEPFWNLELGPREAVLTQVGAAPEPQETVFDGEWASLDWQGRTFQWRSQGRGDEGGGTGVPFEATVRGETCQGPRPESYPYTVDYGPEGRTGCCEMTQ